MSCGVNGAYSRPKTTSSYSRPKKTYRPAPKPKMPIFRLREQQPNLTYRPPQMACGSACGSRR